MHTSPRIGVVLATTEKRPRSPDHASFDFAQDEDEFSVPSTVYLILSVVEGRIAPVQTAFAATTEIRILARAARRGALSSDRAAGAALAEALLDRVPDQRFQLRAVE